MIPILFSAFIKYCFIILKSDGSLNVYVLPSSSIYPLSRPDFSLSSFIKLAVFENISFPLVPPNPSLN
uniref:Uncharacterized protein n=1 Tax=Podoviridae sp. ctZkC8 TaxID=2825259 RepID=A0A8S5UC29_9CAUD|nr:MAG TPA: hypothetical protein [Podoviridae sp. ctZkC8]